MAYPDDIPTLARPWAEGKTKDQAPDEPTMLNELTESVQGLMDYVGTAADGRLAKATTDWQQVGGDKRIYIASNPVEAIRADYRHVGHDVDFAMEWDFPGAIFNHPFFSLPVTPNARDQGSVAMGQAALFTYADVTGGGNIIYSGWYTPTNTKTARIQHVAAGTIIHRIVVTGHYRSKDPA